MRSLSAKPTAVTIPTASHNLWFSRRSIRDDEQTVEGPQGKVERCSAQQVSGGKSDRADRNGSSGKYLSSAICAHLLGEKGGEHDERCCRNSGRQTQHKERSRS